MSKIVVITSGGLDSTVLLYSLIHQGHDVRALSVNYGQRHRLELQFAKKQAVVYKRVPYVQVDFIDLASVLPGSSQTDLTVKVPEGHYTEENMKATVVPNRNMILLAIAIGHAIAHKCESVAYAAHAGDHAIYPDCRPEFVDALNGAARLCDFHPVEIIRPFINLTKAQIVTKGLGLGVPFEDTYSCYQGLRIHCGRCGTCVERREAFHLAGFPDPTVYDRSAPTIDEMYRTGLLK